MQLKMKLVLVVLLSQIYSDTSDTAIASRKESIDYLMRIFISSNGFLKINDYNIQFFHILNAVSYSSIWYELGVCVPDTEGCKNGIVVICLVSFFPN